MANKFQVKRTTVSGRTPNTTSSGNSRFIDTGELALNLPDGKLFSSNGSVYFEVGANLINSNITGNLTVNAIIANGSLGAAGQQLVSNGSSVYWSSNSSSNTVTANTLTANVISGENLTINQGISVGNSSVNTSINATAIFSGNTTSNSLVSPTQIAAANTTSNSTINPSTIFVGNSGANALISINQQDYVKNVYSWGIEGANLYIVANGHGLTNTTLTIGSTLVASNIHPWVNGRTIRTRSVKDSNTLVFAWDSSDLGTTLRWSTWSRTNGTATVTLKANSTPSSLTSFSAGIGPGPFLPANGYSAALKDADANNRWTFTKANNTVYTYSQSSFVNKSITISDILFPSSYYQYTVATAVYPTGILSSTANTSSANVGAYCMFVRTSTAHGLTNGVSYTVSGISNSLTGVKYPGVSVSANGTYVAWTSAPGANSTYLAFIIGGKIKGALSPTSTLTTLTAATGTPLITSNNDVAQFDAFAQGTAYLVPYLPSSTSPDGPTAQITASEPIVLQVANTGTRVKVTPTSIFVGNTGSGTYAYINSSASAFNKVGSALRSILSGDGLKIQSLDETEGYVIANDYSFFANATTATLGNSTIFTSLTPLQVQSRGYTALTSDSNAAVTIDYSSISMVDDNSTVSRITASSAEFGGSVIVNNALILNNTLVANGDPGAAGQVLTSSNTGNVYWSTITTAGGTINYAQNAAPSLYVNSTSAVTLAQISITTSGYPVQIIASGDANPLNAGNWGRLQLFRGSTAIGAQTHFESSAGNENVPYSLNFIDNPGSPGTYTYALKSTYVTGNTQFGETDGPVINVIELQTIQGAVNTAQQYTWTNNHIHTNNTKLILAPLAGGSNVYFIQQSDDNFVFYSSNTVNGQRPVWSIYANSVTSNLNISVPVNFNGNVGLNSVALNANGSTGTSGQVLTSNGSATYWSTVSSGGGGGNITFSATPPVSPTVGNDWIDTDTGIRYTYTYDGDSYQWVEFGTSNLPNSTDTSIHPFMLMGA
jgi:hypothetical protein